MRRFVKHPVFALVLLAAAFACAICAVAVQAVRLQSVREINAAEARSRQTATGFADVAAAWMESDTLQPLNRVIELMLLGTAVYVQIVVDGQTLSDRREAGWETVEIPPLAGGELRSFLLHGERGILIGDTVVALPQKASGPGRGFVRVGYELNVLRSDLRGLHLGASIVSLGAWAALTGGALFLIGPRRRRKRSPGIEAGSATPFLINEETKEVVVCGQTVDLTPKPFRLLSLLASEGGRVYGDEEILSHVWPNARFADSGDIRQCIYLLRRKLDDARPGAGRAIVNVKGFGYRLDTNVLRVPEAPSLREKTGGQDV
jgi:DNA-binding winged helix-turn-helix (wHTH) protein